MAKGGSGIREETVMPEVAPLNGAAPTEELAPSGCYRRVSEMQAKLHRWAAADPSAGLMICSTPDHLGGGLGSGRTNRGARTAGSDGLTEARIESEIGVPVFLNGLRKQVKSGQFQPQPVRERKIPKPGGSGKVRRLGIPTVTDRVVQAALKVVLEPIFETDFESRSLTGFGPHGHAHDAIAEIHLFGTSGYRWVLDADIEASSRFSRPFCSRTP
jgi:RNA-directed DNA polymerase